MITAMHLTELREFCQQMYALCVDEEVVARRVRACSHLDDAAMLARLATVLQDAREQAAV